MGLYDQDEAKARREYRIRLGLLVKQSPSMFTATMSDGIVLVGLAATETETAVEEDEEEIAESTGVQPAVYWYTFPAYKRPDGPFPIKIGRGNSPEIRIAQQVTSMPEQPEVLGTYEHADVNNLERALHAVLTLRGKRKHDAPGTEWFMTTPQEVSQLIKVVLG
ncbi:GIY-YIG nuclease family protein [Variovorax ureilyticus]|uniref:GIY-YIG nuclease family protein n=1 Tax=Variovorax ureilyticus TaxID=1836198 RepID=UPI003D667FE1